MTASQMNGIDVEALAAFAAAVGSDSRQGTVAFNVRTEWKGQTKSVTQISDYTIGGRKIGRCFEIAADEPGELLGGNSAPNPQEILMAALNACMSVGYSANAAAMGIELKSLTIETQGQLDLRGFLGLDPAVRPGYQEVRLTVRIESPAPRERLERLHQRVIETSPNFSNFATAIRMVPKLIVDSP